MAFPLLACFLASLDVNAVREPEANRIQETRTRADERKESDSSSESAARKYMESSWRVGGVGHRQSLGCVECRCWGALPLREADGPGTSWCRAGEGCFITERWALALSLALLLLKRVARLVCDMPGAAYIGLSSATESSPWLDNAVKVDVQPPSFSHFGHTAYRV